MKRDSRWIAGRERSGGNRTWNNITAVVSVRWQRSFQGCLNAAGTGRKIMKVCGETLTGTKESVWKGLKRFVWQYSKRRGVGVCHGQIRGQRLNGRREEERGYEIVFDMKRSSFLDGGELEKSECDLRYSQTNQTKTQCHFGEHLWWLLQSQTAWQGKRKECWTLLPLRCQRWDGRFSRQILFLFKHPSALLGTSGVWLLGTRSENEWSMLKQNNSAGIVLPQWLMYHIW